MKKMAFLLFSIFFFIIAIIYLSREKELVPQLRFGATSFMEDVGIIHRKDGDVKWTLKAKEAVFVNKTEVNLSDLSIRFPEKELILTARNGTYGLENQNLTISGDLKAVTKDYDIVATSVFWDASKNQLFSDKKVSLVGSTFFVEGDSLIATSDKATLTKNVKAVFYDK